MLTVLPYVGVFLLGGLFGTFLTALMVANGRDEEDSGDR